MARDQQERAERGLERVLSPKSVVLVGATERSTWSNYALGNLTRCGFEGAVHLVNRKGAPVHGRPAATSCAELGEPIDMALLMVPADATIDALKDAASAGAAGAVVLSSGFSEAGHEGVARQQALAAAARELGVRLIGPNCLGFVNMTARTPLWTGPLRRPLPGGRVGIISQSGAVASHMNEFAYLQGIGLTALVSTGNEADIDVADVLDHLASDLDTHAIGLFLESIRRPAAFEAAANRAREAGKGLVVLKVGSSEVTARAAAAHTGSLVGDDRVFSAVCRDLGIVRVQSLEQLVITADLLARIKPIRKPGLGLVAMSGGICEIVADQAEAEGLVLPELEASTSAAISEALPGFGTPQNPLDVTGGAIMTPEVFQHGIAAMGRDPRIGVMACVFDAPHALKGGEFRLEVMRQVKAAADAVEAPVVLFSNAMSEVSAEIRQAADEIGVTYLGCGAGHGIAALAKAVEASGLDSRKRAALKASTSEPPVISGERGALEYLAGHGVPVIPATLAGSAEQAAEAARALAGPVVLKIASPDILHKTDVGGVALNVAPDAAGESYQQIMASVRAAAPDARIDGVIVSPMRRGGVELLVGVTRDPMWGPTLALGFGGALVELLKDTSLRRLPIDREDVLAMLGELKASQLLDGYRGAPPVDREAIAAAVLGIAEAAMVLGPKLEALEVNPLLAFEGGVEALDALVITAP